MRRSLRTRALDAVAYAAVRVLICIVQSLPRDLCERFPPGAAALSWFAGGVRV